MSPKQALPANSIISIFIYDLQCASIGLDVLIFDLIPIEGNDTFRSEIEAHGGPRSASTRLDPPRVDFHWGSDLS